jgi:hypothetical protein
VNLTLSGKRQTDQSVLARKTLVCDQTDLRTTAEAFNPPTNKALHLCDTLNTSTTFTQVIPDAPNSWKWETHLTKLSELVQ